MEHILTHFPFSEISILGNFSGHHQLWLSSSFTDQPGEHAYNFALLNDLEQLVQHPTRIPDRLGDRPNILDFVLPPTLLHILSSFSLRWAPLITTLFLYPVLSLLHILWTNRKGVAFGILLHLGGITWGCTFLISHGMSTASRTETPLCVPSASQRWLSLEWRHTFHVLFLLFMLKPWFNDTSRAVQDREAFHKRYQSRQTPANHDLYISAPNRAKFILRRYKIHFINRKCQNLAFPNSSRDFWHLAKNISSPFTSSSFPSP